MNTITKKDLVKRIAYTTGERQRVVARIVDELIENIATSLLRGERVEIRRFGVFRVRFREGKTTTNPKTRKKMEIPPHKVASFKPGKTLTERLNQK